jgi:NAD(P)H-hydrate epimerase
MHIATVAQMRAMDRAAIDRFGIAELQLMENAGSAAYRVMAERWGVWGNRYLVLCGPGNNGGDGFVVARKILADGGEPVVALLGEPARYQGAAAANLEILRRLGLTVTHLEDAEALEPLLCGCDGVVDALLGTGLSKPVSGLFAAVIEAVNASGRPVLSLDIPSGVNGDNGQIMGTAVKAHLTVTFGLPKAGNLLFPGFARGGELFVTHIGLPPDLTAACDLQLAVNGPPPLPRRDPAGYKGSFGDALFIAGSEGYYGAPVLAATAMLKAGGGYARLAAPAPIVPHLAAPGSEVVFLPQAATEAGSIARSNLEALAAASFGCDITVLGPGISLDRETAMLVRELAARIHGPLVLDGDALTAVSQDPALLARRPGPTVLTPHLGEMARLTGKEKADILADPVGAARQAAEDFKAVVVLKGAHTLVALPDGRVFVNLTGNHGMATAGAGDVLTGAIAAMFGLGLALEPAVCLAVFLHGLAGDLAAEALGPDGVTAGEILAHLPAAVRAHREGLPARFQGCCRLTLVS